METGSTIGTEGSGEIVLVLEVVIQTRKVRFDLVCIGIGVGIGNGGAGAKFQDSVHQVGLLGHEVAVGIVVELVAGQQVDGMVAKAAVPS